MKVKNVLLSIVVIVLVVLLEIIIMGYYKKTVEVIKNPLVKMEIKDYGTVEIELYPDKAPNTVANFVKLINDGYYNGLTFHRVIADTLIQGGDKEGTGSGVTDYTISGEFMNNGFKQNDLKHEKGTISMARADYSSYSSYDPSLIYEGYNSGATQFFITLDTIRNFNGLYAAFGKVVSGIEIIQDLSNLEVEEPEKAEDGTETPSEKPKNVPVIENMTVDTFGVDYGEPKRNNEPFNINDWFLKTFSSNSIKTVPELEAEAE